MSMSTGVGFAYPMVPATLVRTWRAGFIIVPIIDLHGVHRMLARHRPHSVVGKYKCRRMTQWRLTNGFLFSSLTIADLRYLTETLVIVIREVRDIHELLTEQQRFQDTGLDVAFESVSLSKDGYAVPCALVYSKLAVTISRIGRLGGRRRWMAFVDNWYCFTCARQHTSRSAQADSRARSLSLIPEV